ncbi:squalene synthase HpnC [Rhodoplanes roseus]|uniref:Squalene synthase HpnC n=1 Tax=Rhodoplanes roseus TaxID=29409 RepID=A0A327L7N1_9BRAD|nr:squalene synthase HpnC [Rhodoplanes roseus]RAI45903.1 squalene synthase HpnC [Rhodoplanes roseus]
MRSGKGSHDENFPVASWIVHPRYRPAILAFYEFVRVADDIADHPSLPEAEKLAFLDRLEGSLLGRGSSEPQGVALKIALADRALSPRHARDLLTAFRLDVTKRRYADFSDLMDYCSYSAMPVGRFVLDLHGERGTTWDANDQLCAALQIINHLQDCAKDYRALDRVYIPLDTFAAHGAAVEDLGAERASPALKACIAGLADRTAGLLDESRVFSSLIRDRRLALEVAVIQSLAERLTAMLKVRDPLSERVHLAKPEVAARGLLGIVRGILGRFRRPPVAAVLPDTASTDPSNQRRRT